MSEFDELAKASGIDAEDESLQLKNTGTGGAYNFPDGEYAVLVGDFNLYYRNKDNKNCKKEDPGATPAFGLQDFLILRDPNKMFVNAKYDLVEGEDVRSYLYKQYVTLISDDQWQNKKIYNSFFIENAPQFDVIQDKDQKDFVIRLNMVKMYYGAPAKLVLKTSAKGNSYLHSVELDKHDITKEKIEKRRAVANKLYSQIDGKWQEYNAKKNEGKSEADDGVVEDVAAPDEIINDFTLE